MRHQRQRYQLSRSASHRKSLLMNLSKEAIEHERIQTVGDLVSKTEGELNAIPNFGKKSIDEVIETLHARGLGLRHD